MIDFVLCSNHNVSTHSNLVVMLPPCGWSYMNERGSGGLCASIRVNHTERFGCPVLFKKKKKSGELMNDVIDRYNNVVTD